MQNKHELAKVFTSINNERVMRNFFNEIFTEAERKDFALRWRLMKMLDEKIPQREIASRLGISLCKITRGAKIVKKNNSVTKKILDSNK